MGRLSAAFGCRWRPMFARLSDACRHLQTQGCFLSGWMLCVQHITCPVGIKKYIFRLYFYNCVGAQPFCSDTVFKGISSPKLVAIFAQAKSFNVSLPTLEIYV